MKTQFLQQFVLLSPDRKICYPRNCESLATALRALRATNAKKFYYLHFENFIFRIQSVKEENLGNVVEARLSKK